MLEGRKPVFQGKLARSARLWRRTTAWRATLGLIVNRKRVQRLMRLISEDTVARILFTQRNSKACMCPLLRFTTETKSARGMLAMLMPLTNKLATL